MIQKFINKQLEVVIKKLQPKNEVGNTLIESEPVTASANTFKYTYRTLHVALEYAIKVGI